MSALDCHVTVFCFQTNHDAIVFQTALLQVLGCRHGASNSDLTCLNTIVNSNVMQ